MIQKIQDQKIGVIFDLDGTFLDDIHLIRDIPLFLAKAYGKSLSKEQLEEITEDTLEDLAGTGSKLLVVKSLRSLAMKLSIPWYKRFGFIHKASVYYHQNISDCALFEGAMEAVVQIKQNFGPVGIYTTSSWKEIKERFVNRMDLLEVFGDCIIGRDRVKRTKPNPEGIEILSKKWQIPPDRILMVGDMATDIEAGKNFGAITVGVLTGFGTRATFEAAKADFILPSIKELPNVLAKLK